MLMTRTCVVQKSIDIILVKITRYWVKLNTYFSFIIQWDESNERQLTMKNLHFDAAGTYYCEVTTDTPIYTKESQLAPFHVIRKYFLLTILILLRVYSRYPIPVWFWHFINEIYTWSLVLLGRLTRHKLF